MSDVGRVYGRSRRRDCAIPAGAADVRSGVWDAADEALLAGYGSGDATAAAAFVRRFQRRVYGLARSVVGDDGVAAEVAQDAFVKAWRHAGTFDARRGSVATWLLAITRNLAIDRVRMERVRPADPTDPASMIRAGNGPDPSDEAAVGDDTRRALAALAQLPEAQRRSVVLATIGGRTAQEISEVEQIPLGTAKTRIRDGLRRLRAWMDSEEVNR